MRPVDGLVSHTARRHRAAPSAPSRRRMKRSVICSEATETKNKKNQRQLMSSEFQWNLWFKIKFSCSVEPFFYLATSDDQNSKSLLKWITSLGHVMCVLQSLSEDELHVDGNNSYLRCLSFGVFESDTNRCVNTLAVDWCAFWGYLLIRLTTTASNWTFVRHLLIFYERCK